MRVELLTFDGCANRDAACALVGSVARELGVEAEIEIVEVADTDEAERLRFLGSPTLRIGGRDIEPGAGARTDFALCCRVYRTEAGVAGLPPRDLIRAALAEAAGA